MAIAPTAECLGRSPSWGSRAQLRAQKRTGPHGTRGPADRQPAARRQSPTRGCGCRRPARADPEPQSWTCRGDTERTEEAGGGGGDQGHSGHRSTLYATPTKGAAFSHRLPQTWYSHGRFLKRDFTELSDAEGTWKTRGRGWNDGMSVHKSTFILIPGLSPAPSSHEPREEARKCPEDNRWQSLRGSDRKTKTKTRLARGPEAGRTVSSQGRGDPTTPRALQLQKHPQPSAWRTGLLPTWSQAASRQDSDPPPQARGRGLGDPWAAGRSPAPAGLQRGTQQRRWQTPAPGAQLTSCLQVFRGPGLRSGPANPQACAAHAWDSHTGLRTPVTAINTETQVSKGKAGVSR